MTVFSRGDLRRRLSIATLERRLGIGVDPEFPEPSGTEPRYIGGLFERAQQTAACTVPKADIVVGASPENHKRRGVDSARHDSESTDV